MLISMAWRNLWRNKKRSIITLSAMVFGLFSCWVVFAIGDGSHIQMTKVATSTYLGHIQINQKGFLKTQKLALTLPEKSLVHTWLRQSTNPKNQKPLMPWQKQIKSWSTRVVGAGLISTGKLSSGGFLLGLDLPREGRVTRLPESILKSIAKVYLLQEKGINRLPKDYVQHLKNDLVAKAQKEGISLTFPLSQSMKKKVQADWLPMILHTTTQKYLSHTQNTNKIFGALFQKNEVIIGKGLATTLRANVGSSIAIVTQAYDGSMANDRYQVVGIVESGNPELDLSLCILPLKELQELLFLEGKIHSYVLKLHVENGKQIKQVAQRFVEALRKKGISTLTQPSDRSDSLSTPKKVWEVLAWQDMAPELDEFIQTDEAGQFLMTLIVFFLVAFIILNTLQMSIMERTREFGVLRSIGMKGRQLIALVLWEGFLLALVSIGIGLALSFPVMFWLESFGIPLKEPLQMGGILMDMRLEGKMTLQGLLFSPAIMIFTTLLVSFVPAFRAAKLKPVEALRHV